MMRLDDTPIFRTLVDVPRLCSPMQPNDGFVFLGSCFAQYVGNKFFEYGLPTLVNPLGTLYNPVSIESAVAQAVNPNVDEYIFESKGEFFCWIAFTQLRDRCRANLRQRLYDSLGTLKHHIATSKYLFLTLGTNVVYVHRQLNTVVSNCHKMPQSMFEERRLGLDDCMCVLRRTVLLARQINPGLNIVFTVSPYRYAKYGYHQSQIAKSTLLLAIQALCEEMPDVCGYFPSYEIQLDELRDYRFYAPDMHHPSQEAIDYIWQRLVKHFFSDEARQYINEFEPLRRGLMHKPLHSQSPEELLRQKGLKEKIEALHSRYGIDSIPL